MTSNPGLQSIPKWKMALWDKNAVEPAMLRAPIILIIFVIFWAIVVLIMDKTHLPYNAVLSIKTSPLMFALFMGLALGAIYSVIVTLISNSFGWSVEVGVACFYLVLLLLHFVPGIPGVENRTHFYRILRTCFVPGSTIAFTEILVADALCSLSKVLKDFGTSFLSMYAAFQHRSLVEFHDNGMILVAVLASIPFAVRIRQCWVQLDSCGDRIAKIGPSLNIVKYMTGFPPIWLAAAASLGYQNPNLPEFITLMAGLNSTYSFVWDIVMDWGLISCSRQEGKRLYMRQRTLYPWPVYVLLVLVNLVLRFSWLINRVPGMQNMHTSVIVLILELGEIFRRALWFIFRIEWEILVTLERSAKQAALAEEQSRAADSSAIVAVAGSSSSTSSSSSGRRTLNPTSADIGGGGSSSSSSEGGGGEGALNEDEPLESAPLLGQLSGEVELAAFPRSRNNSGGSRH